MATLQKEIIFLLSITLAFISLPTLAKDKIEKKYIRINKPQSSSDATFSYYTGLIHLALKKINKDDDYEIVVTDSTLSQKRSLMELEKKEGSINIYQTGTSIEREKNLIPIRIPLLKGTLGYRINIIHRDNIEKFDKIKTLKDLSVLTACQGAHWPDSDILESADLKVMRNVNYNSMFLQIKNKRCDYFPRAIIEAYPEAEAYNDPDLVVYDKLILSYIFPMYFFVSPHQKQLSKDIEEGLSVAIDDGSFDEYFKSNASSHHIFPLSKWASRRILPIKNKELPASTPQHNHKLWIDLIPSNTD